MTSPDGCICTYHEPGDGTYTRTANKDCKAKHFAFEAKVEPHPPLCPKADSVFDTPCGLIGVWPVAWGHLHESNAAQRVFLARYQACAWMDRADRWWRIFMRRYHRNRNCIALHEASGKCHDVARAWREWEKLR